MTKLFVGGLQYSKTNQDLQAMFEAFGQVQSAQVITDKYTGQSKGFGFVEIVNCFISFTNRVINCRAH